MHCGNEARMRRGQRDGQRQATMEGRATVRAGQQNGVRGTHVRKRKKVTVEHWRAGMQQLGWAHVAVENKSRRRDFRPEPPPADEPLPLGVGR